MKVAIQSDAGIGELEPFDLAGIYTDLHSHPELAFSEVRTASVAADHLVKLGFEVHTQIGRTGVVAIFRNGDGPAVMLRADMDALPIKEETGLPYASAVRVIGAEGAEIPVMHACGHDVHVTCLIGAAESLRRSVDDWSGTVIALFQPGEEVAQGASAMVADGLTTLIPRPDVVLAQHVGPHPTGLIGAHAGPALASTDTLTVRMFGRGGHGSRPESTIDPVVLAASTVMRLQGIVSREISAFESAVVTVGSIHAGSKGSIIPPYADIEISVRTFTEATRETVFSAIRRIVDAEALASGAETPPLIEFGDCSPVTINDEPATQKVMESLRAEFGVGVVDIGSQLASEDVMYLAEATDSPLVYWGFGGGDASSSEIESNHSPKFAPTIQPTLDIGVKAFVAAAAPWLRGT